MGVEADEKDWSEREVCVLLRMVVDEDFGVSGEE